MIRKVKTPLELRDECLEQFKGCEDSYSTMHFFLIPRKVDVMNEKTGQKEKFWFWLEHLPVIKERVYRTIAVGADSVVYSVPTDKWKITEVIPYKNFWNAKVHEEENYLNPSE